MSRDPASADVDTMLDSARARPPAERSIDCDLKHQTDEDVMLHMKLTISRGAAPLLAIALLFSACQVHAVTPWRSGSVEGPRSSTSGPRGSVSTASIGSATTSSSGGRTVEMPDVARQTRDLARQVLLEAGVRGEIIDRPGDPARGDYRSLVVCSQTPPLGYRVPVDRPVTLYYCPPDASPDPALPGTTLVGYTVAEATRRARAAGFQAEIEVRELGEFAPDCRAGAVCRIHPLRWELNNGRLTLWVNQQVKIRTPD